MNQSPLPATRFLLVTSLTIWLTCLTPGPPPKPHP